MEEIPNNSLKTRPNAGKGLWILFLLPVSLITSTLRNPVIVSPTYKLTLLLCIGLLMTSINIFLQNYKNRRLKIINKWSLLSLLLTVALFNFVLHKGLTFSVISGIVCTIGYIRTYVFILNNFKNCFTFGEAGLVSQGLLILLYCTFNNIQNFIRSDASNMQIATLIIQVYFLFQLCRRIKKCNESTPFIVTLAILVVFLWQNLINANIGLLGIGILSYLVYLLNVRTTKSFYLLTCGVIIFIINLPLHILLKISPFLWILDLIFRDLSIKYIYTVYFKMYSFFLNLLPDLVDF